MHAVSNVVISEIKETHQCCQSMTFFPHKSEILRYAFHIIIYQIFIFSTS